jgi:AcrR family transcriptional regulator
MQDIADATGLHKSSLYHHVPGKVELLEIICAGALDELFGSLDDASAGAGRPGDRVIAILAAAARTAMADVRRISIVLHLNADHGVADTIWQRRREYDRRLAEVVEQAQRAGEARDDIDALLLTRLALGMINWVTEWYRPGQGRYDADTVTRSVTAFVAQGIRPPSAIDGQDVPKADAAT